MPIKKARVVGTNILTRSINSTTGLPQFSVVPKDPLNYTLYTDKLLIDANGNTIVKYTKYS